MKNRFAVVPAALILTACGFCACSKKNVKQGPAAPETSAPVLPGDGSVSEADVRGAGETSALETITFDFDKYQLSDPARAMLQKNAAQIKAVKGSEVIVEGNCDDRGTIEYNLALGQKRAKEVREYYMRLGVPGTSIGTISYGKEKPVCQEATEDCWAKNRRADTKIRAKAPAAVSEK